MISNEFGVVSTMSVSSVSSDTRRQRRPRYIPERVDLFSKHDGEEFRSRYKISKTAALQICTRLDLEHFTQRNKPITALTQLLIGLRFLATGSVNQVINELTNIHKSTVCRIVQRVTLELAKLSSVYIKMPEGKELLTVADEFYTIAGLPNVAGVLGCMQVRIHNIGRGQALSEAFRNKYGFYSINVQVVCDASLRIRDLVARWPGSVHDSTIFENSHLNCDFELGRYGDYHLIGDLCYYNKDYLLTPILQPETNAEEAYNRSQLATYSTVQKCLQVWKQRCPSIQKGILLKKTSTVLQVIVASAVLHNICIELGEDAPPADLLVEESPVIPCVPSETIQETDVRTTLVNTIFT